MARIGRLLSSEQARKLVDRRLSPGSIVFLRVIFPDTRETKDKFLVFVGREDDYCYFVINSRIHRLVQRNAALLRCQVLIDVANHTFLQHDSYIACDKVIRIPEAEVFAVLCDDLTRIKGTVSNAVRDQIVSAVKHAVTLSPVVQRIILQSIDTMDGADG